MKYSLILKIFIIFLLILYIPIWVKIIYSNLYEINYKNVKESFDSPLNIQSSKAFCDINKGGQQEIACNALTKYNCGLTSCCIWTSDDKCKAGNKSGPLFNSDSKGKTLPLDYYYFQNQCYGPQC